MKLNEPLLYAVVTREFPGKVRLRFVTFTEEFIDRAEFERNLNKTYTLCDMNDPRVREFREIANGK